MSLQSEMPDLAIKALKAIVDTLSTDAIKKSIDFFLDPSSKKYVIHNQWANQSKGKFCGCAIGWLLAFDSKELGSRTADLVRVVTDSANELNSIRLGHRETPYEHFTDWFDSTPKELSLPLVVDQLQVALGSRA